MKKSSKKYKLKISAPFPILHTDLFGYQEVLHLDSDEPFPPFFKGDLINLQNWRSLNQTLYQSQYFNYGDLLEVESTTHCIFQSETGAYEGHVIMMITTKILNKNA